MLRWFPEPLFVRKFHPHTAEIEKVTGNASPSQQHGVFGGPLTSAICAAKTTTFPRITATLTARRI